MPQNSNFPLQKMWPPAIPWLTPPAQTQSLGDCEVSEVCDQAELLKLPAQLQNATSILYPLQMPKNSNFPLQKMWPPAIPWLILPAPMQSLDDSCVGEVWDWAEPLKSAALL